MWMVSAAGRFDSKKRSPTMNIHALIPSDTTIESFNKAAISAGRSDLPSGQNADEVSTFSRKFLQYPAKSYHL